MQIEREIVFPASPAEVWEALTEPERLEEWFATEVELDAAARRRGRLPLGRRRRAPRRRPRGRARRSGSCSTGRTRARSCSSSKRSRAARGCTSSRPRPTGARRSSCTRSHGSGRVDRVFDALGDPGRRSLVEAVAARGSATATELAAELPVTRQAVAKQLDGARRRRAPARDARGPRDTLRGDAASRSATPSRGWSRSAARGTTGSRSSPTLRSLGIEPLDDPARRRPPVAEAVVQAVVAVLPELPRVRARAGSLPTSPAAAASAAGELGDAAPRARRGSRAPRSAVTRARRRAHRAGASRSTRPTPPADTRSTAPSTRTCRPSGSQ